MAYMLYILAHCCLSMNNKAYFAGNIYIYMHMCTITCGHKYKYTYTHTFHLRIRNNSKNGSHDFLIM